MHIVLSQLVDVDCYYGRSLLINFWCIEVYSATNQ